MEKFKAADEKNNNFLERNERSAGGTADEGAGTERGEDVLTPNTLVARPPLQTVGAIRWRRGCEMVNTGVAQALPAIL